jgi:hypothetical protein
MEYVTYYIVTKNNGKHITTMVLPFFIIYTQKDNLHKFNLQKQRPTHFLYQNFTKKCKAPNITIYKAATITIAKLTMIHKLVRYLHNERVCQTMKEKHIYT